MVYKRFYIIELEEEIMNTLGVLGSIVVIIWGIILFFFQIRNERSHISSVEKLLINKDDNKKNL